MNKTGRLHETRNCDPREHDSREFEDRTTEGREEYREPQWNIEAYDPAVVNGRIRLPVTKEEGFGYLAARCSARGQFDPRSEELQDSKQYARVSPMKLKDKSRINPKSIDAPFQVRIKDTELLYRPVAFNKKDEEERRRKAASQIRNTSAEVKDMSYGQIAREYGLNEF